MNRVILDLETTGLDPKSGHKIVEIGCIKLNGREKTDQVFHVYVDPERDMPEGAFKVHGISASFLKGKPKFKDIAKDFLDFIGDATIIAHNASFDVGFLNYELGALGYGSIENHRVVDTLFIARRTFPGAPASLDALCRRFNISLEDRKKKGHGALLDSELLYEVYIRLVEGVQSELIDSRLKTNQQRQNSSVSNDKKRLEARKFSYPSDNKDHEEFVKKIKNHLWSKESL
jgi:DNA polymerase III subunit epsilon